MTPRGLRPRARFTISQATALRICTSVMIASAIAILLGMCAGCAGLLASGTDVPEKRYGLDSSEQFRASAFVIVLCDDGNAFNGSAVLISSTRVLTSLHVVDCLPGEPDPAATALPYAIIVSIDDEHRYTAEIERVSYDTDVARLRLDGVVTDIEPATETGSAQPGDVACASTAAPEWAWSCGVVTATGRARGSDIHLSAPIRRGNSGAGLYNAAGLLVGIVTRCESGGHDGCNLEGGRAASIPVWAVAP